jgi:hypothetical protein
VARKAAGNPASPDRSDAQCDTSDAAAGHWDLAHVTAYSARCTQVGNLPIHGYRHLPPAAGSTTVGSLPSPGACPRHVKLNCDRRFGLRLYSIKRSPEYRSGNSVILRHLKSLPETLKSVFTILAQFPKLAFNRHGQPAIAGADLAVG